MKLTNTILAIIGLLALGVTANASPFPYRFRITDNSGVLVAGATVAVGSTTLTAGTAVSVPAAAGEKVAATNAAPAAAQSMTLLDYGTGDYAIVTDAATQGELYIPLTVSKTGSTITGTNALIGITATIDSTNISSTLTSSNNNGTAIATGNGQTTAAALGTAVWTTPTTRTVTGGTVTASNFVAAPTVAQVAAGILTTPANLLATNATGQVSASNLPADYLSSAEQTTLNGAATVPGVWNAVSASYVTAGSEGAKLAAAGSAGDPWATLTANETTAGSFGVLMNTNLNATVGGVPAATATALMTRPIKAGLTFGQLLVGLEAADTKVAAITNTWNATTHILTTAYQFTGDTGAVLTTNTQYPTTQTSAPAVSGITTTVGTISQP